MPRTSVSEKGHCHHHYSTIFVICHARAELCSTGARKPEVHPVDIHTKYNCYQKKKKIKIKALLVSDIGKSPSSKMGKTELVRITVRELELQSGDWNK